MKVEKLDGRWAVVDVPAEAIEALRLKDGDEVSLQVVDSKFEIAKREGIEAAIELMRSSRLPMPRNWKFDREEANQRGSE